MNKITFDLKNCFGIVNLHHEFDFSKCNTNLIYAPNGSMKSSFANTLMCLSKGDTPEDKIHHESSKCDIEIDGVRIKPEQIFVIESFNEQYQSAGISTILVNSLQKEKYEKSISEIVQVKTLLISRLQKLSKIKKDDIEKTLNKDFDKDDIFEIIKDNYVDIKNSQVKEYPEIQYDSIFNEKVLNLLKEEELIKNIEKYTNTYNQLIEKSTYFKKSIFNPAKADTVQKTLKKENYFKAGHSINLFGDIEPTTDDKGLEEKLVKAREEILSDPQLIEINKKIINGVAAVKVFQDLLENVPEISTELNDLESLRKNIWKYYFYLEIDNLKELLEKYDSNIEAIREIESQAKIEESQWYNAVQIFKRRFYVPFDIDIEDKKSVILGQKAPNIIFKFKNNGKEKNFDKNSLMDLKVLSQGERRALYLLYIIFEIESFRKMGNQKIIIVDDIADSFDYKNKYAIIEYLKEISDEGIFRQIILTHNFDFYRTIQQRILDTSRWNNSVIAQRKDDGIVLRRGGDKTSTNPFEIWRKNINTNKRMFIASIPFIRNIIEYKEGASHPDYMLLTSLLHIKESPKSVNICISDIQELFKKYICDVSLEFDNSKKAIDLIYSTADEVFLDVEPEEINLENKICLSIAIRLKAEEFIWQKISDKNEICRNQTGRLFDRYKTEFYSDTTKKDSISILGGVMLMTPENIHLNSFMYEPLIDLSEKHLKDLYSDVKKLNEL